MNLKKGMLVLARETVSRYELLGVVSDIDGVKVLVEWTNAPKRYAQSSWYDRVYAEAARATFLKHYQADR